MRSFVRVGLVLGVWSGLSAEGWSGDWPRFLGPFHNARADQADAVGFWPASGLKKRWEVAKGKGWACPAVVGNRVLIFHREESQEILDCVDAGSGKRLWRAGYEAIYRDRFGSGEGPRSSPVVEGNRVFVFGVTGQLRCVDLEKGATLWERDVKRDYEMQPNFFGHGSTPLVVEGRVVVQVGGSGERSVVALDAATGREVWVSKHRWGASYASPVPARVTIQGKERGIILVFAGGESRPPTGGLLCLDGATGQVLGEVEHRARIAESVNAASPVVYGRRVFTTEGYGSGSVLSEIEKDGALRVVWRSSRLGSQFFTPLEKEGMLYGFDGQNPRLAELVCLDATTGQEKWREDFGGSFGRGSLVDLGAEGVLVFGEYGEVLRVQCSAEGARVLQRARLWEAPETWTMPVLAGRRLYVSQNERGRDGTGPRVVCYEF